MILLELFNISTQPNKQLTKSTKQAINQTNRTNNKQPKQKQNKTKTKTFTMNPCNITDWETHGPQQFIHGPARVIVDGEKDKTTTKK